MTIKSERVARALDFEDRTFCKPRTCPRCGELMGRLNQRGQTKIKAESGYNLWFCCADCKREWLAATKAYKDLPALPGDPLEDSMRLLGLNQDEEED